MRGKVFFFVVCHEPDGPEAEGGANECLFAVSETDTPDGRGPYEQGQTTTIINEKAISKKKKKSANRTTEPLSPGAAETLIITDSRKLA